MMMKVREHPAHLGLIGFGEAGEAFSRGWRADAPQLSITAYDLKTDSSDAAIVAAKHRDYEAAKVSGQNTAALALAEAPIVFSLVTADQALMAAQSAAATMSRGAFYFDGNSCAPDTKRAAARVIEQAGCHYIDTAIMSPVHPKLHQTPLLISGHDAETAAPMLAALGMMATVVPGSIGRASSIKMMRSVMVKGIEALVLESMLAARKAGVEAEVLASLDATFPGFDWPKRAAYMIERTTTHGQRRAAEMREVTKTVRDLELPANMAQATANWQQAMGDLGLPPGPADVGQRADAILTALKTEDRT